MLYYLYRCAHLLLRRTCARWVTVLMMLASAMLLLSYFKRQLPTNTHKEYVRILQDVMQNSTPRVSEQSLLSDSLLYEVSMRRVQDAMQSSIYRFDRKLRLPLMRLTKEQQNRTFRVMEARRWLKTQRLVVAGAVRNAMGGVGQSMAQLRELSTLFDSVTAVFVENDSKDGTRSFLYNMTKNSTDRFRLFLLGCGTVNSPSPCHHNISYGSSGRKHTPGHWEQAKRNLEEESTDRGLVMAALRNIYLQFIYDRVSADLLMVLESDVLWNKWDLDVIAQGLYHFKSKRELDSLCAFTLHWNIALLDPCTLIFFHNKHFYVDSGETDGPFLGRIGQTNSQYKKQLNLPHSKPEDVPQQPVKVASCFQGMAFYRMSSLRAASAFYQYSEGEWHCEHSTLSRQLRENYLDTQMPLICTNHKFG